MRNLFRSLMKSLAKRSNKRTAKKLSIPKATATDKPVAMARPPEISKSPLAVAGDVPKPSDGLKPSLAKPPVGPKLPDIRKLAPSAQQSSKPRSNALDGMLSMFKSLMPKSSNKRTANKLTVPKASDAKKPSPQDTVPAMLKPGEVVLNEKQQGNLGKLSGLNPAKLFRKIGVPGFAGGGKVTGQTFWGAKVPTARTAGRGKVQGFNPGGLVAGLLVGAARMVGGAALKTAASGGARAGAGSAVRAATKPKLNMSRVMMAGMGGGQEGTKAEIARQEDDQKRAKNKQAMKDETQQRMKLVTKLMLFTGTIVGLVPLIKKWSDGLAESRRAMVKFNGSIAAAFASLDVKQFHLNLQKASATQGSTTGLIKAIEELNRAFAPMNEDLLTVGNALATVVVKIGYYVSRGYQVIKHYFPKIDKVLEAIEQMLGDSENRTPQARALMQEILSDRAGPARRANAREPLGRVN